MGLNQAVLSSLRCDTKYFSSGLALESPHLSLPCRSSGTELSSPSAVSRYRHTLLLLLLLPAGDGWWSRAAAGWDTSHRWGSSPGIQGIHPRAGGISGVTEETHLLVILLQQGSVALLGLAIQKSCRRSKVGLDSHLWLVTQLQAGLDPLLLSVAAA